ncbi:MAG: DUF3987 domain-containing protein [Microcoleus sp.]
MSKSYPTGETFAYSNSGLIRASKANPCPHCGKPDWCYTVGELSVCNRDQPPATGWEATSKADKEGHYFYARPQEKKPVRPRQTRHWRYDTRDGSTLIRVVRVDDGEGGKKIWQEHWDGSEWQKGLGDVARKDIPIFAYYDIRKAIKDGQPIFIVEGEACADALWDLGIAATTNIGGSGKWQDSDTRDLRGAKMVVIVPDRDIPGVEHAEKIAQSFPDALWLYPFPESKPWENLPKSQGLDVADWIAQEELTLSQVNAAIGEKKAFPVPQATTKTNRSRQSEPLDAGKLDEEIDQLLESGLSKSKVRLKLLTLAKDYGCTVADLQKVYELKEQERDQETDKEEVRIDIEELLASKNASVELSELFPSSLAEPIKEVARRKSLKSECYALALITGISRFIKNGSSTMLVKESNRYRCRTFGYFGGIIAESSQMKTPVMNDMIVDPLASMRVKNKRVFDAQQRVHAEALQAWKNSDEPDKGLAPEPPVQINPYITKATWEAVAGMVGRSPDQGILWISDELAGFFNSANQYRGGRGSDKEDLLEAWSGNGAVVARAAGPVVDVGAMSLSIYGNIQPKVLAPLLGDGEDNNGTFARFDFVQQPLAASQIVLDLPNIDINPMLEALYAKVDAMPVRHFELDLEAKKTFVDYYNRCQQLRIRHPRQGMRAMIGKAAEKVGRVATILHVIAAAHMGAEASDMIPAKHVIAAIKWVEYTTQQALSLNVEVSDPKALAPNLAKILALAERRNGTVSARDVSKTYDSKHRVTSQDIRQWFDELASMKYGEVTTKGRSILFSIASVSPISPNFQNQDPVRITNGDTPLSPISPISPIVNDSINLNKENGDNWGYIGDNPIPNQNPLLNKGFSAIGDIGDTFSPPSEILQPLMQSCTTTPTQPKGVTLKKGLRVRYVGDNAGCVAQYGKLDLVVDEVKNHYVACLKPDGSFTTWLNPRDLRAIPD